MGVADNPMTGPEQFECCNCFKIGALNSHGGCAECGSQAVISQELMLSAAANSSCTTPTATR
jgi:hypothetical protein